MGELRFFLAAPLHVVVGWTFLRHTTPAEGMVEKKLTASWNPDMSRFLVSLPLWAVVGIAVLAVFVAFRSGLADAVEVMIVGAVLWFAVLVFEERLESGRQARRDRVAADLAAKSRGEAGADPWQTEQSASGAGSLS